MPGTVYVRLMLKAISLVVDTWYSGLWKACHLQDRSGGRLYGSQASWGEHSGNGLQNSKLLTTSVSTSHGIYVWIAKWRRCRVNFTGAWAIVGVKAWRTWQSVSRNHFLFCAVCVLRHSRLLRRRGLDMDGRFEWYINVGQCFCRRKIRMRVVLRGPHDFSWHQRWGDLSACINVTTRVEKSAMSFGFQCRTGVVGAYSLSVFPKKK